MGARARGGEEVTVAPWAASCHTPIKGAPTRDPDRVLCGGHRFQPSLLPTTLLTRLDPRSGTPCGHQRGQVGAPPVPKKVEEDGDLTPPVFMPHSTLLGSLFWLRNYYGGLWPQ